MNQIKQMRLMLKNREKKNKFLAEWSDKWMII